MSADGDDRTQLTRLRQAHPDPIDRTPRPLRPRRHSPPPRRSNSNATRNQDRALRAYARSFHPLDGDDEL